MVAWQGARIAALQAAVVGLERRTKAHFRITIMDWTMHVHVQKPKWNWALLGIPALILRLRAQKTVEAIVGKLKVPLVVETLMVRNVYSQAYFVPPGKSFASQSPKFPEIGIVKKP